MRIRESFHEGCEDYSGEIRQQVEEVYRYAIQTVEIKRLLADIKKEAVNLRELFLTEEELKERRESLSFFDARMQASVFYTLKNLEGYRKYGWRKLIFEEEDTDGSVNPV